MSCVTRRLAARVPAAVSVAALATTLLSAGSAEATVTASADGDSGARQGGYEGDFEFFAEAGQQFGAEPHILAAIHDVCYSGGYDTWMCLDEDEVDDGDGEDFQASLDVVAEAQNNAEKSHVRSPEHLEVDDGYSGGFTDERGELDGAAAERLRDRAEDGWIAVVEELPIEDADDNAAEIVATARGWMVGDQREDMQCSESATPTSGDGEVDVPEEYADDVDAAAAESGIPGDILAAQIQQESQWDPEAVSPVGARGLTQFMPETWDSVMPGEDPFDPEASIEAQGIYMADLVEEIEDLASDDDEVIELALAAYNAGPGAVREHDGIPPFDETEEYVPSIMSSSGDVAFQNNCLGVGFASTVDGVGEDDYPHREPEGVDGWGSRSEFGATHRQCTDFVLWRLNQQYGYEAGDGDPAFTIPNDQISYPPGGSGAGSWMEMFTAADGIEDADEPEPGDIAWWGYDDVGGGFGHVGWVAEVDDDGTAMVEHYNYPDANVYSVTEEDADSVPGFIRITEDFEP